MECSTGNCTFDTYQSLGVCSSCADISDLLHNSSRFDEGFESRVYTYTLSNGLSLTTSEGIPVIMNASTYLDLLRLDMGNAALIANLTAISLSIPSAFSGNPQPRATECTLYFCINTYETLVRGGQLSENRTHVSTSSNTTSLVDDVLQDFALTPSTCYFNKTHTQDPHSDYKNCVYKVDEFSRLALRNSISPLLNGTALSQSTYRQIWTDPIEALYGTAGTFTDIESTFRSLASALTTNARTRICNARVEGTAWTSQSFVHVRWQWMALPLALLALGVSFLVGTVVKTRNQHIWKSSPLALLISNLPSGASLFTESGPTLSNMDQSAKELKVRLETSSEGISFESVPHYE